MAKDRLYEVIPRTFEDEKLLEELGQSPSRKRGKKYDPNMPVLERDYGKLTGIMLKKWHWFADKACEKVPQLAKIELDVDLKVEFEINPKVESLVKMLEQLDRPKSKRGPRRKDGLEEASSN